MSSSAFAVILLIAILMYDVLGKRSVFQRIGVQIREA